MNYNSILNILYWKIKYHFFWTDRDAFVTLSVLAFTLLTALDGPGPRRVVRACVGPLAAAASLLCLGFFLACAWSYASGRAVIDTAEANIASVSGLWAQGGPIYHGIESAARYSFLYGPTTYVLYGSSLLALGPSIRAVKVVPALCITTALGVLYLLLRRETSTRTALVATAACSLGLMPYEWPYSYMIRADPPLVLLTVLGLSASRSRSPARASVASGIALGLAVDVKIHAVLYLLPSLGLLYQRHGPARVALAVAVAAAVALAPFLMLPGISLPNYLAWLALAGRHGLSPSYAAKNLQWELALVSPCALALAAMALRDRGRCVRLVRRNLPFLAALGLSGLLVLAPASKRGAGPHHLMPLVPTLAFALGKTLHAIPAPAAAAGWRLNALLSVTIVCTLSFLLPPALSQGWHYFTLIRSKGREAGEILAEIEGVQRRHPGVTIGMGYAGDAGYPYTYYRPSLIFAGNPLLLDASAMFDMQQSGLAIPPATLRAMRDGRTAVWLIPAGEAPFSMNNYYALYDDPPREQALFDRAFRDVFYENYEKRERTPHYDVWFVKGARGERASRD
jgi:hypothetical protein